VNAPSPDIAHEPHMTCEANHCYIHNVDEPAESVLAVVCHECNHCYPSERDLELADDRLRYDMGMTPRPHNQPVHACPTCGHDL
jgi:hypothetical protein